MFNQIQHNHNQNSQTFIVT